MALFLTGTIEGTKEKKKKAPTVPKTLKKRFLLCQKPLRESKGIFAELKVKCLRKKFAQNML
jgi:hypothetical protein